MAKDQTEIMSPEDNQENALSWGGQLTTTELKESCVAEARKASNIRIRQVKDLIKTSGEELKKKVEALVDACNKRAEGFMEEQLTAAGKSLESVFGVPVIHKITPLPDSFDEEKQTFDVRISIGFKDRTPGIPSIHGSSAGFDQDLYMESEIENGEEVTNLLKEIEELRETRKGYSEEIAELEDFLDCGIQIVEGEFVSRVTRAKLASCKDGEKITNAINEAMADSGVQQLLPRSLVQMGLGRSSLPAPAEEG